MASNEKSADFIRRQMFDIVRHVKKNTIPDGRLLFAIIIFECWMSLNFFFYLDDSIWLWYFFIIPFALKEHFKFKVEIDIV